MQRVQQLHADILKSADPESISLIKKFGRKIGKTAWSIWDHKKRAAALCFVGLAASVATGIMTGGASLVVQFAIGTAVGLAKTAGGNVADNIEYKMNKRSLAKLTAAAPEKIGRAGLRTMKDNLDYNEEHFKTALYKVTQAYLVLKTYKHAVDQVSQDSTGSQVVGQRKTLSAKDAEGLLVAMYNFHIEYDRAVHYFSSFETFVEFSHAFVFNLAKNYNRDSATWDGAVDRTVKQSRDWHSSTCRKSRRPFKTDVCYGLQAGGVEIPGSDGGLPHHPVT